MVDQAEADGLYESLDVTPEQVRVVELEEEVATLTDLAYRTSKIHRKTTKALKQSLRVLLAHTEGRKKATAKQLERARRRLEHG